MSVSSEAGPAARVDDVLGGLLGDRPVRDRSMSAEAQALLREWFAAPDGGSADATTQVEAPEPTARPLAAPSPGASMECWSLPLRALVEAVAGVRVQVPTELPGPQAVAGGAGAAAAAGGPALGRAQPHRRRRHPHPAHLRRRLLDRRLARCAADQPDAERGRVRPPPRRLPRAGGSGRSRQPVGRRRRTGRRSPGQGPAAPGPARRTHRRPTRRRHDRRGRRRRGAHRGLPSPRRPRRRPPPAHRPARPARAHRHSPEQPARPVHRRARSCSPPRWKPGSCPAPSACCSTPCCRSSSRTAPNEPTSTAACACA